MTDKLVYSVYVHEMQVIKLYFCRKALKFQFEKLNPKIFSPPFLGITGEFFYKAFTSPFVLYSNSALKRNEKICYSEFVITVWSHKVHFNRGLSLKLKEILKMNGIYVYTFLGSGSYRHFLLPPEF